MRFWLDTEFIERGPQYPIELISIGIVCEDGRELYRQSSEFDAINASDWVRKNVLPHLSGQYFSLKEIAADIVEFVAPRWPGDSAHMSQSERDRLMALEFWGYFSDYDWVVFCGIFGTMMDLPEGFPMFCNDLKQWCMALGNPRLPPQESTEHNALSDARWNKVAWEFLQQVRP